MSNKQKWLTFIAIVVFYCALAIATDRLPQCNDVCMKVYGVDTLLRKKTYVFWDSRTNDTSFCVYVKDTTGINWNLLADTTCIIMNSQGLNHFHVFIIQNMIYPPDTVANKKCN